MSNDMKTTEKKPSDEVFSVTMFNAVEIGKNLKEVAVELIDTDQQQILSRWYHSENDVDVYVWLDTKKNIIKQQVSLCGQLVEWNIIDGIRTGFVIEEETEGGGDDHQAVKFDPVPINNTVVQAIHIVKNAVEVSVNDRQSILENFTHGKTIKDINRQEFAKRFGPQLPEMEGLWSKFKRWMAA